LFYHVLKLINAGCYPESDHCYEIFGADIMIDKKFNLILLEINSKVDYSYNTEKMKDMRQDIINGIFLKVIDTLYPPKNIINDNWEKYLVDVTDFCNDIEYKYHKYKSKYCDIKNNFSSINGGTETIFPYKWKNYKDINQVIWDKFNKLSNYDYSSRVSNEKYFINFLHCFPSYRAHPRPICQLEKVK